MNPLMLKYINLVSTLLSHLLKHQSNRRLRRLSVQFDFGPLPAGWVQAIHPADLTNIWRKAGLPVEGVGYSTIGAPTSQSQIATRFLPASPYYQAWLGGYIVKHDGGFGSNPDGTPSPETLMQVAVADQIAWLHNYGCKEPQVSMKPSSFHLLEYTQHQNRMAWLGEGTFLSNSDVGYNNRRVNGYFIYRTYERMFERFGDVRLPALCTLPPRLDLPSYHLLELDGLSLFVPVPEHNVWIILYGCAARWNEHNYLPVLREEILSVIKQTKILRSEKVA